MDGLEALTKRYIDEKGSFFSSWSGWIDVWLPE